MSSTSDAKEREIKYTFEGLAIEDFGYYRGEWLYRIYADGVQIISFVNRGRATQSDLDKKLAEWEKRKENCPLGTIQDLS